MFAVVENEQNVAPQDSLDQGLRCLGMAQLDPECRRDDARNQRGIRNWSHFDQPDAVGKIVYRLRCDFDGEPRLADSAASGEGHQPVGRQQVPQLGKFGLAADDRRRLQRKIRPVPIGYVIVDGSGQRPCTRDLHGRDKPVPPFRNCLEISRRGAVIAQCMAQHRYAARQRFIAHIGMLPDRLDQVVATDRVTGATRERDQNLHRARFDMHLAGDRNDTATARMNRVIA